ncbi:MAG: hypothetical protein J3K34DRAFT_440194 [Monoraphidium minutum]|nr:MAG: hypothetical protein J3K34DRAFT_440194 [Monoraphidium minutum]
MQGGSLFWAASARDSRGARQRGAAAWAGESRGTPWAAASQGACKCWWLRHAIYVQARGEEKRRGGVGVVGLLGCDGGRRCRPPRRTRCARSNAFFGDFSNRLESRGRRARGRGPLAAAARGALMPRPAVSIVYCGFLWLPGDVCFACDRRWCHQTLQARPGQRLKAGGERGAARRRKRAIQSRMWSGQGARRGAAQARADP